MTRAARAAALALALAALSGCGTLANFGGKGWARTRIYGGVRTDVESAQQWIADNPITPQSDWIKDIGTGVGVGLVALDVPLSAIGDTLTLPITVPVAIWASTRGPATVNAAKQQAAKPPASVSAAATPARP